MCNRPTPNTSTMWSLSILAVMLVTSLVTYSEASHPDRKSCSYNDGTCSPHCISLGHMVGACYEGKCYCQRSIIVKRKTCQTDADCDAYCRHYGQTGRFCETGRNHCHCYGR